MREQCDRHGHQLREGHIELKDAHDSAAHVAGRDVLNQNRARHHHGGHAGAQTKVADHNVQLAFTQHEDHEGERKQQRAKGDKGAAVNKIGESSEH